MLDVDTSRAVIASRLEGLMTEHRKQVVAVYLAIRVLFMLASVIFLALVTGGLVELPAQLHLDVGVVEKLRGPLLLFAAWSAVLFVVGVLAVLRGQFSGIDWLIRVSLLPDGLAVYMASAIAGTGESPFYHSVYFLIAIHSYHLVAPGSFSEGAVTRHWRLLGRYVGFSVLPTVLVSMFIYETLSGATPGRLDFWLELGLQLITASAFMLLGLTSLLRFRSLAEGEANLTRAQTKLAAAERQVTEAQTELSRIDDDLQRARRQQEKLLQALPKVTNIAEMQTEGNLQVALRGLAEEIGKTLEAEYCAIGLARETRAEDIAVWTSRKLSPEAVQELEATRFVPLEGSLVGSVMLRYKATFEWAEEEHGDLLDPDNPELARRGVSVLRAAADSYRGILPSGRNKYVLLTPFFVPGEEMKPVGYVHLINRRRDQGSGRTERFMAADRDTLEAVVPLLAIAIENFRQQQREQELRSSQEAFESLAQSQDSNAMFNGLLAYINRVSDSKVASLWLPIEDGLSSAEEVRKLLLRAVHVRGEERRARANEELARKLRQRSLYRLEESYMGKVLREAAETPEIHYEPDLSRQTHCWQQYLEEIGTPRLIVVPIQDPLPEAFTQGQPAAWKGVMALLCLRPLSPDFVLTDEVRQRLSRFGRQLGDVILERRLKRRFDQIGVLQRRLQDLGVSDLSGFHARVVDVVKEVMGAEACSLFMADRAPGMLVLKATTAEKATVSLSGEPAHDVATDTCIDQPIFALDDASLTSATYRNSTAVLVHNTLDRRPESPRFREVTRTVASRSFLAAPVVRSDGQPVGVLRCINQDYPGRMSPGFLPADRDFLALLTGIMARFVESAQFAEQKNRFLNELSHELATPLLQARLHVSFLEKVWKGDREIRDPAEQFVYLRESLHSVESLVRDIQYQYGRTLSTLVNYDCSRKVDLHKSLEMMRHLFLHGARTERACEIHGRTRSLPQLYIDKQRMEQVFYNLLQNAVKYSRWAGGAIRIEHRVVPRRFCGSDEEQWHEITITNFGIGIAEGEEESIFSEYVRGSNAAKTPGGQSGTGLGLAVSRRIVENHGGRLVLLHRGAPTVFAVFLPASLEEHPPRHENSTHRR